MGRRFGGVKGIDAFGKVRPLLRVLSSGEQLHLAAVLGLVETLRAADRLGTQTLEDVKIKTGFGGACASLARLIIPTSSLSHSQEHAH